METVFRQGWPTVPPEFDHWQQCLLQQQYEQQHEEQQPVCEQEESKCGEDEHIFDWFINNLAGDTGAPSPSHTVSESHQAPFSTLTGERQRARRFSEPNIPFGVLPEDWSGTRMPRKAQSDLGMKGAGARVVPRKAQSDLGLDAFKRYSRVEEQQEQQQQQQQQQQQALGVSMDISAMAQPIYFVQPSASPIIPLKNPFQLLVPFAPPAATAAAASTTGTATAERTTVPPLPRSVPHIEEQKSPEPELREPDCPLSPKKRQRVIAGMDDLDKKKYPYDDPRLEILGDRFSAIEKAANANADMVQFCSVCLRIRRRKGEFVGGHIPNGLCPVKGRKATPEEKRSLRRCRQRLRRNSQKKKKILLLAQQQHEQQEQVEETYG